MAAKEEMEKAQEKYRRSVGRWRLGFAAVALLSIALLIAVVVLAVKLNSVTTVVPPCGGSQAVVDISEATEPGPHHDLTQRELKEVEDYLYQQSGLNLAAKGDFNISKAELYLAELLPPPKADVLQFYSGRGPQPPRQARVMISRGDKTPPVVEEYAVTLTGPGAPKHELMSSSVRKNPVPFNYRPFSTSEFIAIGGLLPEVDRVLGSIVQESYGATFTECEKCLAIYPIPLTSAVEGVESRRIWLRVMQNVEYHTIHPVDMALLVDTAGSNPKQFAITKVFYAGTVYSSMEALANAYNNLAQTNKTRVPFPTPDENLYSVMRRRGDPVPRKPMRAPHLVEPDGKRYNIRHRHLEYMQWEADFRMSALNGPQLYNVQFRGERIAYQVGLQEIAVFYSGANGVTRLADFLDSGALLGIHSRGLVPGADCPLTATYVGASFLKEYERPQHSKRAFCVFEQNTGIPLRRHSSWRLDQGSFYAGVLDSVLVLRTILTVANYDYVLDFVFHQSGALQVRTLSTGYILSSFYKGPGNNYGWRIQDHILGNLHHHLFNFKVDLDILGTTNRYETLDIGAEKVSNGDFTDSSTSDYWQTRFQRSLKQTEKQALYNFNFDVPKYHIVYKEGGNTREGTPRSYRIKMDGSSKLLLPPNLGNEPSVSWARHQLVATRYKPEEYSSTTPYSLFDANDPTVNFTKFYEDDESIVDEDLVFWLSMGVHHIPHTEDLPVTPTPGFSLDFTLLPYNYFPECPSMQSRDAIRLEFRTKGRPDQGVRVVREGHAAQAQCVTQTGSLEDDLANDPDLGLQTGF